MLSAAFAGFFLMGVIPLYVLWLEFDELTTLIVKTWAHFYLFPVLFGWAILPLATLPVMYVYRSGRYGRLAMIYSATAAFLIALIALVMIELPGTPAVFEVKRSTLDTKLKTRAGSRALPVAASSIPDEITLATHFVTPPVEQTPTAIAARWQFENHLREIVERGKHRSWSRWCYIGNFLLLTTVLVFLFLVTASTAVGLHREQFTNAELRTPAAWLTVCLVLAALWFPMRMAWEGFSPQLYEAHSTRRASQVILILYGAGIASVAGMLWVRLAAKLEAILGVVALFPLGAEAFKPGLTSRYFQRDEPFQNYALLLLLCITLFTPIIFGHVLPKAKLPRPRR